MKTQRTLIALALSLAAPKAFADCVPNAPTVDEHQQAIATMMLTGAIEWKDGRWAIKNPSALQQLLESGRAVTIHSAMQTICWKE